MGPEREETWTRRKEDSGPEREEPGTCRREDTGPKLKGEEKPDQAEPEDGGVRLREAGWGAKGGGVQT
ncbi:hypothetical protein NDU88_003184 [Pleurodeles waltl]|uniref:Uncharacterized protein n=1 Tax=Pleurodeles waltl TaxID=8319 RepID=A0AAV7TMU7_PLEWA|nr:hypothetical protein NDU88_003184 [Pleurodeles waltl]